jgi:hypothetical protein
MQVCSIILRPKRFETPQKLENCERADKNQTDCNEIEPKLWKDRAMQYSILKTISLFKSCLYKGKL